ncbi:MAG: PAS domain S-box protein [Kosmotoga sp.]|uniref:PAS domain S-box protein n=1 Tax=Kosmotoga sp. TaxID=1955248 RepID=UPI001D5AA284|nr:PAS domain S-box protein [Kosmotoga sp.]MBO8167316.1 PAS domain S-box protein [Kosmotoga sp.]
MFEKLDSSFLKCLLQKQKNALLLFDAQGKLKAWNNSALEIIGLQNKELENLTFTGLFVTPNSEKVLSSLLKGKRNSICFEAVLNAEKSLEVDCESIKAPSSQTFVLCTFRPSSSRETDFGKITEVENWFNVLAETAPMAILLYQNNKWIYANSMAEKISGYTKKELQSMNFWELVKSDYRQFVKETGAKRQKGEKSTECYELEIINKAGKTKWLYLTSDTTVYKGKPAGIVVAMDITTQKEIEKALRESEEKFHKYFEMAQVINLVLDKKGNVKLINKKGINLLGYEKKEIIGKNWFKFIPDNVKEEVKAVFEKLLKDPSKAGFFENPIIDAKGNKIMISWRNAVIYNEKEEIEAVLSSGMDVTREKEMLEQINKYKNLYEVLLEITSAALKKGWTEEDYQSLLEKIVNVIPEAQAGSAVIKNDGRFYFVASVGYDFEKLRKISFSEREIMSYSSQPTFVRFSEIGFKREDKRNEIFKQIGTTRIKSVLIIPIYIGKEPVSIIFLDNFDSYEAFDDIELEFAKLIKRHMELLLLKVKTENQLLYATEHDPLTGVLNRRAFAKMAEGIINLSKRYGHTFSVMYLDCDGFKQVNDSYGHDIGDILLNRICRRIERLIRESDIFARVGGDEFLILLPETGSESAKMLSERIKNILSKEFVINNHKVKISMSIGIASFPKDGEDIETLTQLADRRMYLSKKNTKTR